MQFNSTPRTHEHLEAELQALDGETRSLTRATAELYRLAAARREEVTDEDVALVREAKRDTGRARQICQGLARRWTS